MKLTETYLILDTNALRQIAHEKISFRRLKQELLSKNIKVFMSIPVSMELLKHLDDGDPASLDCYNALRVQYELSRHASNSGEIINYLPPLDILICNHFFKRSPVQSMYYDKILPLVEILVRENDHQSYKSNTQNIDLVREQLLCERRKIVNDIETCIKEYNEGSDNWHLFKNNPTLKRELLKDIKTQKTMAMIAFWLIRRAHSQLHLEFPQPQVRDRIDDFCNFYEPVLRLRQTIIEKLILGVESLSQEDNKVWNTLLDIEILGSLCFLAYQNREKEVECSLLLLTKPLKTLVEIPFLRIVFKTLTLL